MTKLSLKSYWEQFQPAPEFVVMFIPGEAFYSAALEQDPGLIEEGVSQSVLLATPTTLIGVLKAVAYGWHQETVAESARAVSQLGKELHGRLAVLGDHMAKLGLQLDRAVSTYNQTVGSLERRVLPAARRFSDLGAGAGREIPVLEPIDKSDAGSAGARVDGWPSARPSRGRRRGSRARRGLAGAQASVAQERADALEGLEVVVVADRPDVPAVRQRLVHDEVEAVRAAPRALCRRADTSRPSQPVGRRLGSATRRLGSRS